MRTATARRRAAAAVAAFALVLAPAVAEAKTIKGSPHNDKLVGTAKADKISGLNGNDKITGKGGKDTVSGGTGNDTIYGNAGNDVLSGNLGNDVVTGGSGDDNVNTGPPAKGAQSPDNDTADGGDGDDLITTGPGNDRLDGGADGDWLLGADGNDVVHGGDGADHPQGGPGNDRVYGDTGRDELDGDEGDDFIDGGSGPESCANVVDATSVDSCKIKMKGAAAKKPAMGPNITGDTGNDVIYPGDGIDVAFGEEGFDTFVVVDDGSYDRLFCADAAGGEQIPADLRQAGRVIYVGGVDPLDDIRNCAAGQVTSMSAAAFMRNANLTYPHSKTHLPLPTTAFHPSARASHLPRWMSF